MLLMPESMNEAHLDVSVSIISLFCQLFGARVSSIKQIDISMEILQFLNFLFFK